MSYPPLRECESGMYTMQTVLDLCIENDIHLCKMCSGNSFLVHKSLIISWKRARLHSSLTFLLISVFCSPGKWLTL